MIEPDSSFEAAAAHYREGRAEEAAAACRDILNRSPDHERALHLFGVIRAASGDVNGGMTLVRQALTVRPDYAEAHFNLGALLASVGQPAEAAQHYAEAERLKPDDIAAYIRHGAMLSMAGQAEKAIQQYRKVLARWPDCLPVMLELSALFMTRGAIEKALEMAQRAVKLAPDNPAALTRLGRSLKQAGRMTEAVTEYRKALARDPRCLEALNFLAVALYEQGALKEAESVIARALHQAPKDASSHFNAGMIAQSIGDLATATTLIRRALELAPDDPLYRRVLLTTILYDPMLDERARASIHRDFGTRILSVANPTLRMANTANPDRRIRIGWLSSDLRDHPVARNIGPILTHYDRSAFEMYLYGEVLQPDEITFRLRSQADHWYSTIGQSDQEVAERIRGDGIDILIFLAARFDRNRPEVAAWRAAPIQVSFHDPATSGLAAMDYLIADRRLAPRRSEEWFAERVLALPTFYLHPPIESSPEPGPLPMTARGGVTFGSFNHPAKANDEVLRLWARLLREIKGSRLILKYRAYYAEAPIRARIQRAAEAAGIDADRFVVLGEREERGIHLSRYREIDVALDPFPFSGSTTTFEALWMGVPVVTLPGTNMASRWSAAMLHALQRDEWIADSAASYIRIASQLAHNVGHLAEVRRCLRREMLRGPLCDAARRTGQIERLLRAMWRRWCSQEASAA